MKVISSMYEKSFQPQIKLSFDNADVYALDVWRNIVVSHINKLNIVTKPITQLSSMGIKFDNEVTALLLLSSLPYSWSLIVTTMSSSSWSQKMKLWYLWFGSLGWDQTKRFGWIFILFGITYKSKRKRFNQKISMWKIKGKTMHTIQIMIHPFVSPILWSSIKE